MKKRILGILFCCVMLLSLIPAAVFAEDDSSTGADKAIQIATSQIKGGQADSVYFGTYGQSDDGNGGYNIDPIKWRVLSNADGKMFLLSDQNLDVKLYNSSDTSITWEKSTIRSWLNGYGASENSYGTDYSSDNFIDTAFFGEEQSAIADTYVYNATQSNGHGKPNPSYDTSGGENTTDKIFLLSIEEANNGSYFPNGNDSRKSTNTAYAASYKDMKAVGEVDYWWLRSPGNNVNFAADVLIYGIVDVLGGYVNNPTYAVRPAFNLNTSSVLFTSVAEGGKADTTADENLTAITDYTGSEWKLTLKDSSRSFSANVSGQTSASAAAGNSVQITYSGAQTGDNEYVSVLLCDSNDNVLYYGNIAQGSASGTASVTIPAGLAEGNYTLKVFSEQCNGDKKTDYASDFQNISLTVEAASYLISTAEELKAFRDAVNSGNATINAKLMNDIVLNDGTFDKDGKYTPGASGKDAELWEPIGWKTGDGKAPYSGTFDGNGHTVKGLYVKDVLCAGLFGYAENATIKNTAVDGYISNSVDNNYSGGIAGYFSGGAITSCFNSCTVVNTADGAGGIVGEIAQYGKITDCGNAGTISGSWSAGGIMGFTSGEYITVKNCYNIGAVGNDQSRFVGGIVGVHNVGWIENCYSLTGTAKRAIGNIGDANFAKVYIKTADEFANGTVLNALKNGDENSPWAKCGYLEAAGMIVPLLDWQTAGTFLIYTAEDLKAFRDAVNSGNANINAKLMDDIVLNDGTFDKDGNYTKGASGKDAELWTPIGWKTDDGKATYSGTFDGNGHTVKGLYVKDVKHAGLFGYAEGATIKNMAVDGYISNSVDYNYSGGIVGYLSGGSATGCMNFCTINTTGPAGGIVGTIMQGGNITDCGNAGTIGGKSYKGGIAGETGNSSTTIQNCYNIGAIISDKSRFAGGIVGCHGNGWIRNCYWPKGTADGVKLYYDGHWANTSDKSKTEFADGTVLELLKNNRADSPWTKCGYLEAAGMIVPLLDWQTADSHDHNFEWKHTDTEHWKECGCGVNDKDSKAAHSGTDDGDCTTAVVCVCGVTITAAKGEHNWGNWAQDSGNDTHTRKCLTEGCSASETKPCSGGAATCTEKAKCDLCGESYGELKPHSYSSDWSADETNHWHKCTECEAKSDEAKHADTDKDHKCDVCKKVLSVCADTDKDHKCDICGKKLSKHTGGTATCKDKAVCEICGESYGKLKPHSYSSDWSADETNHWHKCTKCEAKSDEAKHADADKDHKCDVCKKVLSVCADTDKDHKCDICGKKLSKHTGGTATCKDKAVCEICGESYGKTNSDNHAELKHIDAKAATETAEGNIEYWYCEACGKYFADKDGTKKIKQADTVTPKLTEKPTIFPSTGDAGNLALWIALLLISSGAGILTTVYGRKRKRIIK